MPNKCSTIFSSQFVKKKKKKKLIERSIFLQQSMEDLREEPELEEREEEEEEEEEEEDTQEPEVDENKDQPQECQQEEQKEANSDEDGELLVMPVRNKTARRASLTDELDPDETQALLETNFSVTGLNEIKTERIIPKANNITKSAMPKRPMSLDLNAPIKFRKLRGAARPEKVTVKLINGDEMNLQSRGRGYAGVASAYRAQNN